MEYKLGEAAAAVGVSVDTMRRWIDQGQVAGRRSSGGQRLVDGADLARYLRAEHATPEWASTQSARNRFVGIITDVKVDDAGIAAQVEIRSGPHRIVSLITGESVRELGLEPGVLAVAAVKSTNVVIETKPR